MVFRTQIQDFEKMEPKSETSRWDLQVGNGLVNNKTHQVPKKQKNVFENDFEISFDFPHPLLCVFRDNNPGKMYNYLGL